MPNTSQVSNIHAMAYITEIGLFALLVLFVHSILRWWSHKKAVVTTFANASIPGPVPSPLTGNFRDYLKNDLKHETLDKWAKQYGPVYGYYQGEKPCLVLSDVDDVYEVVHKLGKSFPNRLRSNVNVEPFLSSLFGQKGDDWKKSRKIVASLFDHKIVLKTSKLMINEAVKRLLVALESQRLKSSGSIDVARYMQSVTLDVISRLVFNMEDTTDLYEDDSNLRNLTTEFKENSSNLILQLTAYFPFLQRVAEFVCNMQGSGKLVDHLMEHLNKCIIEYYQKRIRQKFSDGTTKDTKINILDFMLEQQEQGNLSETELIGNSIAILQNSEATATGLTYTMYLLAKHQEIQTKLRQEIRNKHTEPENFCHFDHNRCELLDRVWYESLRIYPPIVAFMTRELDDKVQSVQLSKSGVQITKDMCVQIPVWSIHHNEKYWNEPNRFNPFRENLPIPGTTTKQNEAFFAFGSGPRSCIGTNLANSEARAVLTAILSRYRIDLVDDEKVVSITNPETGLLKLTCKSVFIHPKHKIFLKFTPITDL